MNLTEKQDLLFRLQCLLNYAEVLSDLNLDDLSDDFTQEVNLLLEHVKKLEVDKK